MLKMAVERDFPFYRLFKKKQRSLFIRRTVYGRYY